MRAEPPSEGNVTAARNRTVGALRTLRPQGGVLFLHIPRDSRCTDRHQAHRPVTWRLGSRSRRPRIGGPTCTPCAPGTTRWSTPQSVTMVGSPTRSHTEETERALLSKRLARWSSRYPDVVVRQTVVRGRSAPASLEFVEWRSSLQSAAVAADSARPTAGVHQPRVDHPRRMPGRGGPAPLPPLIPPPLTPTRITGDLPCGVAEQSSFSVRREARDGVGQSVPGADLGQPSIGSDVPAEDACASASIAYRKRPSAERSSSRSPVCPSTAVPAAASARIGEPSSATSDRDTAPSAKLVAYTKRPSPPEPAQQISLRPLPSDREAAASPWAVSGRGRLPDLGVERLGHHQGLAAGEREPVRRRCRTTRPHAGRPATQPRPR